MQTIQKVPTDKRALLFYLSLLTSCFVCIEISFFIQCHQEYLYLSKFIARNLHIPVTIVPGILFFLSVQCALHVGFCLLAWWMTIVLAPVLRIPDQKRYLFAIVVWMIALWAALSANQYLYPNSKFAGLTGLILVNSQLAKISMLIFASIWLVLLSFAIVQSLRMWLLVIVVVMSFYLTGKHPSYSNGQGAEDTTYPNVFIIGIDSLRPDFVGFFGHETATPFLDDFLPQSTVFAEAITPLARTFPSWVGILTGKYPKEIGIRTNLASQVNLNYAASLGKILQAQGYETIFATDETRFSNIDEQFGFDKIVSPPIGLNDFLLGSFNDFPLSNLLVNTWLGRWLFPYSYANRGVFFTYHPQTFINELETTLTSNRKKPLFMAVHFCLPHHPYLWDRLAAVDYSPRERYQASITRVDKQINDFMDLLKQTHLLDKAIVVLLSDHGEALALPGDRITERTLVTPFEKVLPRFYPPSVDEEEFNTSAGHGTDVLGLSQYHSLLAFKLFGLGSQLEQVQTGVVSLLNIKDTVLQLLGFAHDANKVLPIREGKRRPKEHLFLESDFSPAAIRTLYPNIGDVLREGIGLFQTDPYSTRIVVKKKMANMIIESKQYADIFGEWMLALYPIDKQNRQPILINLQTGQWTFRLNSAFAKSAPVNEMLAQLRAFYQEEIKNITMG